jgi:hypothetical protein
MNQFFLITIYFLYFPFIIHLFNKGIILFNFHLIVKFYINLFHYYHIIIIILHLFLLIEFDLNLFMNVFNIC